MEKLQQNIAAQIELGKRKGYILVYVHVNRKL